MHFYKLIRLHIHIKESRPYTDDIVLSSYLFYITHSYHYTNISFLFPPRLIHPILIPTMTISPTCLDFANHEPSAVKTDIDFLARQVTTHGFNAAFVNPIWVSYLKAAYPSLKIGTIVSFPLGQDTLEIKSAAVKAYALAGAMELDTALNLSYIKQGLWDDSLAEMTRLVSDLKSLDSHKIIKFVPETSYLTPTELMKTAELILRSGADFIKTNTGMGPTGARLEDLPIKVAGGISNLHEAEQFLTAGVTRIGTSHALDIINPQPHPIISLTPPPPGE